MNKGLKLVPQVSYVANIFHFVSNLATWHFSNRPSYRKFWLKETGALTETEKGALRKASSLLKKYTFGSPRFWGLVFLAEDDNLVWAKAEELYGKEDFEKFKNIYEIFEPRFNKLWKTDKVLLLRWVERFKELGQKISPAGLPSDLDILFGAKKDFNKVRVVFLINAPDYKGGGGYLRPGNIILELSRTPLDQVRPLVLIMWHEIIHNIWQDKDYWKMIKDLAGEVAARRISSPVNGMPAEVLINEAVAESLLPHGLLAEKYFDFPSQEYFEKELPINKNCGDKISYWRNYSAYKLMPLARRYLNQNKKIDNRFLNKAVKLFQNIDR